MLLEFVDHDEALQIVFEAPMLAHAFVERVLAGVAKRRVAEVVRERDGFDEVFVDAQIARHGPRNLRDFQAVREPCTKQVALVIDEHLRLVFEAPKRGGVNDAVPVALKLGARGRGRLIEMTSTRLR